MIRALLMLAGLCASLLVAFFCLRQVFRALVHESAGGAHPLRPTGPLALSRLRDELDADEVPAAVPVLGERRAPHTH